MTLQQAAQRGIERVRLSHWANAEDYLKIHIADVNGEKLIGPWGELYAPIQETLGFERPQRFPLMGNFGDQWEVYGGPLLEAVPDGDTHAS